MKDFSETHDYSEKDLTAISHADITKHIQLILAHNIPVWRKNNEGDLVPIPANKLEQFIGETGKDIILYLPENWKEKIRNTLPHKTTGTSEDKNSTPPRDPREFLKKFGNAFEQLKSFHNMSIVEREEILDSKIEILHALNAQSRSLDVQVVIDMVEVITNTFYANYANLEDNLSSENVRDNIQGVFTKTKWIINLIIGLFQSTSFSYSDYAVINSIDTGSVTIDNICRGMLWTIGYLLYINDYIDKGLVTKKLRGIYKDRYYRYYNKRLPDASASVETVIKGGMRRINVEKELSTFALGGLLYDIGKIPFIAYHDGREPYDENIMKMHVLTGYNMILKAGQYPFAVIAMAAFHHEYYGGKKSFGFTRPIVKKLTGKVWDGTKARHFITLDENEFKEGAALAYFPCKIIEIIYIFDTLVGNEKCSYLEALTTMKKIYITQNLQIDPILFEIFVEFLGTCSMINENERKKVDSLIY